MARLSEKMRNALGVIAHQMARGRNPLVASAHPGEPLDIGGDVRDDLSGSTLAALYRRRLVSFEVRVRLTDAGEEAVQRDARANPGAHHLRLVENEEEPQ